MFPLPAQLCYCPTNSYLRAHLSEPFLTKLYPYLLANFGSQWYPELKERADVIQNIIQSEETIFLTTLDKGLGLLESVFEQPKLQAQKEIPAETAFKLYDTFGFPLDLTVIIAAERGWHVDLQGTISSLVTIPIVLSDIFFSAEVEKLQEKQRAQGRESWKAGDNLAKGRLAGMYQRHALLHHNYI